MSGIGRDGAVSRRDFFTRGLSRAIGRAATVLGEEIAPARYVRPPGALPEAAFVAACTRCGACADACPPRVIRMESQGAGLAVGTPTLDLATGACLMCPDMPCATACPTSALAVPDDGWAQVRLADLLLDTARCLPHRDVACGICALACPVGEGALATDDRGRPVVGAACTGCGQCLSACVTTPTSLAARPPQPRYA